MSVASDRLREFHEAFDVTLDYEQRRALADEENVELTTALTDLMEWAGDRSNLLPAVAGELADVVIVAYGTADVLGIDLDIALRIKMDANMAKLPECPNPRCDDGDVAGGPMGHLLCPDCGGSGRGKPIKDPDTGKVLKPDGWQQPSMAGALR